MESNQENSELLIPGAGLGIVFTASLIVGSNLAVGCITGLITATSICFFLEQMSNRFSFINTLILKYGLGVDILLSFGIAYLLGATTATGIIASATSALITSVYINFKSKPFFGPTQPTSQPI